MDFVTLQTSRLILQGISAEKMKTIFNTLSKSEIKKTLGHRSEEEYLKEENKHIKGYCSYNRTFLLFLLIDLETGNVIGRCGLHNWNEEHQRAEIGYVMHEENFKRKGLMSEAVSAIIDYGFSELKLNRIEALAGMENEASIKILEKYNFIQEGVLRQHQYVVDHYTDSVIYSKLNHEHNLQKLNNTTKDQK